MDPSPFFFSDRRIHFALLVVVVIFAAALRMYFFGGYDGLDDAEYARIAYQIGNGTFSLKEYSGPPVFPLRIGLIFPTSLFIRLFVKHRFANFVFINIRITVTVPFLLCKWQD